MTDDRKDDPVTPPETGPDAEAPGSQRRRPATPREVYAATVDLFGSDTNVPSEIQKCIDAERAAALRTETDAAIGAEGGEAPC